MRLRRANRWCSRPTTLEAVDAASVTVDNTSGVHAAVAHLVEHGHTRIGFVGKTDHSDIRERYEAYCAAMTEHHLTALEVIPTTDYQEGGGLSAAPVVAAARPALTAVIASTDRNALGLIEGLRAEGIAVPGDVAVFGFDDAEPGRHSDPPLSTVRQQFDDIGATAARILLAELGGSPP